MATYRAGLIGLGWMGWLYDVASRRQEHYGRSGRGSPMPPLRPDRDPPPTAHPGREGLPEQFRRVAGVAPGDGAGCRL